MRRTERPRPIVLVRRDTTEAWESVNPVLRSGEPGLDYTRGAVRIGDGTTPWNDLPDFTGALADPLAPSYDWVPQEQPRRDRFGLGFLLGLGG